jgi:hypothetical protein
MRRTIFSTPPAVPVSASAMVSAHTTRRSVRRRARGDDLGAVAIGSNVAGQLIAALVPARLRRFLLVAIVGDELDLAEPGKAGQHFLAQCRGDVGVASRTASSRKAETRTTGGSPSIGS